MVQGSKKSHTFRRIHKKTTKGSKLIYEPRKPAKASCGNCGAVLLGVPSERPVKMASIPKTSKRPERPFGGVLCSRCMRDYMVFESRDSSDKEE